MVNARELATFLHKHTCHSVGDPLLADTECNRPDGGSHAAQRLGDAKLILKSDDPAIALHDMLCDGHIHFQFHGSLIPGVNCADRQRHIEAFRKADFLGLAPVQEVLL